MDIRSLTTKAKEICKSTSKKIAESTKSISKKGLGFAKKHRVLVSVTAGVSVMVMLMSMVLIKRKDVKIYIDGIETASFSTLLQEPEKWLEHAGTVIHDGDSVVVNGTDVQIQRAFYVTVSADGVDVTFKTTPCSVADALEKAEVTLAEDDEVSAELTATVTEGERITVYRKTTKTITKTKTIDYKTVEKKTDKLYVGEKKVETEGKNGKKELVYKVFYTDGKETDRELVSEKVVTEAVDKVVLVGTKQKPKVQQTVSSSSGKAPSKYKKVYTMTATAYTYGDDGGNITATGIRPYKGIVAVDPKVIPLGTKLYIETSDGKYVYGTAVAADTGGAIKGNKIDLFLPTESQCRSFGRRTVKVYVIQ